MDQKTVQITLSVIMGISVAFALFCLLKAFVMMGPPSAMDRVSDKWATEQYIHLATRKLCRDLTDDVTVRNELFYYNCLSITQDQLTDLAQAIKGQQ